MKPKTEEFLYFLLWSAEQLTQPTFRNLNNSFETWAYRNGLHRQLGHLEKERFIERKGATRGSRGNEKKPPRERIYRLTAKGREHALGGRDPLARWTRPWDGKWRLVLFDVPVSENKQRFRLTRYLRRRHFGYLQNSVWITPDPMDEEVKTFRGAEIDVESLILLEARPSAGESDQEIVAGAWDFSRINHLYREHLAALDARPGGKIKTESAAKALRSWASRERASWSAAVNADPLLPEALLPGDYLGKKAWTKRAQILAGAGKDLASFSQ
ncbi:hypothetical protein BH20VER3_BH20VER3_17030 [soil metagenome]